jgi:hypothetical protein
MKYLVGNLVLKLLMKRNFFNLGPLLRWIRGGTTRRGNPWAAVIFTFLLVQVRKYDVYSSDFDF